MTAAVASDSARALRSWNSSSERLAAAFHATEHCGSRGASSEALPLSPGTSTSWAEDETTAADDHEASGPPVDPCPLSRATAVVRARVPMRSHVVRSGRELSAGRVPELL